MSAILSGGVSDYRITAPVPSLEKQLECLKEGYPSLSLEIANVGRLPHNAEGWFAFPNIWKNHHALTGNYGNFVVQIFDLIRKKQDGGFCNCFRDFDSSRLRQTTFAEAVLRKISEEQGYPDILVIAAQFGLLHRNLDACQARALMYEQKQFPLGLFAIGNMLLVSPNRLQSKYDLGIDCVGDEYIMKENVAHGYFPSLCFHDGVRNLIASPVVRNSDFYGAVSGFIPD